MASKRANQLRVRTAAATTWSDARARINTISPGIIVTPLAYDEFRAAGDGYQQMINASAARCTGTVDEIANAAEFLLSDKAGFITGADLLIDGGVIAAIESGKYELKGLYNIWLAIFWETPFWSTRKYDGRGIYASHCVYADVKSAELQNQQHYTNDK